CSSDLRFQEAGELPSHGLTSADGTTEHPLIQDHQQTRRTFSLQDGLSFQSSAGQFFDFGRCFGGQPSPENRPGVLLSLKQSRDEQRTVLADLERSTLPLSSVLVPLRQPQV